MSPEQMQDVFDCGSPEQLWTVTIAYLEARARQCDDIGESLARDAQDATERADEYFKQAQDFHSLALAMKAAPVTFPAQAIEAQRAETTEIGSVEDESAVGNADAPKGA